MKKITVLFTVLMMLAASSAFAAITAQYPAALNATWKTYTGFTVNGTANNLKGLRNASEQFFNSTSGGFFANKTYPNATISVYNGTGEAKIVVFDKGVTPFLFAQSLKNVNGLVTMASNNATNATTYFVPASGYTFMIGLSNMTITNATADKNPSAAGALNGSAMSFLYDNGTTLGSTFSTSDTWDYYAFGSDNSTKDVFAICAQVKLNTQTGNDNAQVKFWELDGDTKTSGYTSWIDYNATTNAAGTKLTLDTNKAAPTLFDAATINADRTIITGFVNGSDDGEAYYAIMIRNGQTLSTNDLTNRAFKLVYAGTMDTDAKDQGNATGGVLEFSVDSNLGIDGDAAFINGTQKGSQDYISASLSGFSVALADTSFYGLTQSNMTIYGTDGSTPVGYFYGKQTAQKDMVVGFYEPAQASDGTTVDGLALAVLVPNAAATGVIAPAGAAYQNNGTLTLLTCVQNATSYSAKQMRDNWSGISSDFTPLTEVKGFNATWATGITKGDVYVTFQFPMNGVGDKVENLRLYKVFPTSAKTVRTFNYAGSATPSVEGSWWISTATADGYLNKNSVLAPSVDYYVNWVVKDNGNYDSNSTASSIVDPVVLGSMPTSSSSSSSSGCVFNPAAGFGLEWLLLMLAPMVAIVRSRFKK
ncbi:hypothetical protein [Maridesulfovibrio sp.]|uniref:hypothetical protein n=1 Tax=Maridesulfovibrio sp. TaxID=2795000 RepID=UPI002A189C78|nr:hypothetical protein [Maridesulfovibrio sp.]